MKLFTLTSKTKNILAGGAVLVSLAGIVTTAKALVEVPTKLAQHDSTTRELVEIQRLSLCIQIADHRKMSWTLCYTSPSEVMGR